MALKGSSIDSATSIGWKLQRVVATRPNAANAPTARLAQDEELDRTGDNLFVVHLKRLAFFFAPPSNSARQAGLRHRRHDEKVFLYAFDLIELNGDDLRRDPLEGRKQTLAMMLAKTGLGIRFNEHMEGDGETVFRHACKLGLEGIISKRKDSPYRSGRSPDWLKMKNANAPAVKREEEEEWGNKKRR